MSKVYPQANSASAAPFTATTLREGINSAPLFRPGKRQLADSKPFNQKVRLNIFVGRRIPFPFSLNVSEFGKRNAKTCAVGLDRVKIHVVRLFGVPFTTPLAPFCRRVVKERWLQISKFSIFFLLLMVKISKPNSK